MARIRGGSSTSIDFISSFSFSGGVPFCILISLDGSVSLSRWASSRGATPLRGGIPSRDWISFLCPLPRSGRAKCRCGSAPGGGVAPVGGVSPDAALLLLIAGLPLPVAGLSLQASAPPLVTVLPLAVGWFSTVARIPAVGPPLAVALPPVAEWPLVAGLLSSAAAPSFQAAASPLRVERLPLPAARSPLAGGLPLAMGSPL